MFSFVVRRQPSRSWTSLSRLVVRLAVVMVTILGIARAGSSYFVCAAMPGLTSATPCCAHCGTTGDDGAPAMDRKPCCVRERVDNLPSATTAAGAVVEAAPLVATIDPVSFKGSVPQAPRIFRERASSRTGPPPVDTRPSRLMVFLL